MNPYIRDIGDLVLEASGIDIQKYNSEFFDRRLNSRMQALKLDSNKYVQVLKESHPELRRLIDALTIHHTAFFRDKDKFNALQTVLLPDLLRRIPLSQSIRIWSAGCASGEEAYSIGIAVQSYFENHSIDRVIEIMASDISNHLLSQAKQGSYPIDQIRKDGLDSNFLKKYFFVPEEQETHCLDNEVIQIQPLIKNQITFFQHNLLENSYPEKLDLVFCRNVLIYFKPVVIQKIVLKIYSSLNKHGYLVLGNSEALDVAFFPYFERVKIGKEFVYKKISTPTERS